MRCYSLASARQNRLQVTVLVLEGLGLEQIPLEVWEMPLLETLVLNKNALRDLPLELQELTALKNLQLASNQLKEIPALPPNLIHLDVQKNQLTQFPESIAALNQLQRLNLSSNRMRSFSSAPLFVLKELSVDNNLFISFSLRAAFLPKIEKIHLAKNRLSSIELQGEFPHLDALHLSNNKLNQLPDQLVGLPFLRVLQLSKNQLTGLPDSLSTCVWLKELDLSFNAFRELPSCVSDHERLEELDLAGNKLASLPNLPQNLRKLNLARNQLTALPKPVMLHGTLRSLNLGHNPLKKADGLAKCSNLDQLILTGVRAEDLATELLKLPQPSILSGLPSSPPWKELLPFARACARKNLPESERQLLWEVFLDKMPLTQLPIDLLLKGIAMGIPAFQVRLHTHLLQQRAANFDLSTIKEGTKLAIVGRSTLPKQELEWRLSQKQLQLTPLDQARIWVLARPPFPELLPLSDGIVWLDETELEQLISPDAPIFDALDQEHLLQLLLHEDPINVRLAAQLLSHNGVAPQMLPYLYLAWRWTKEAKLRRELRDLLERNWPPEQKHLLRSRVSIPRDLPWEQAKQRLKVVLGNNFDNALNFEK
jgi:Leucine-rich repeat (LRR) protein